MLLIWLPLFCPRSLVLLVPPSLFTASPEQCSALLMAGTCLVKAKALAQNFLQNVCAPDLCCHPAVTAPCPLQAQRTSLRLTGTIHVPKQGNSMASASLCDRPGHDMSLRCVPAQPSQSSASPGCPAVSIPCSP